MIGETQAHARRLTVDIRPRRHDRHTARTRTDAANHRGGGLAGRQNERVLEVVANVGSSTESSFYVSSGRSRGDSRSPCIQSVAPESLDAHSISAVSSIAALRAAISGSQAPSSSASADG
jgi:hypothetical protein